MILFFVKPLAVPWCPRKSLKYTVWYKVDTAASTLNGIILLFLLLLVFFYFTTVPIEIKRSNIHYVNMFVVLCYPFYIIDCISFCFCTLTYYILLWGSSSCWILYRFFVSLALSCWMAGTAISGGYLLVLLWFIDVRLLFLHSVLPLCMLFKWPLCYYSKLFIVF